MVRSPIIIQSLLCAVFFITACHSNPLPSDQPKDYSKIKKPKELYDVITKRVAAEEQHFHHQLAKAGVKKGADMETIVPIVRNMISETDGKRQTGKYAVTYIREVFGPAWYEEWKIADKAYQNKIAHEKAKSTDKYQEERKENFRKFEEELEKGGLNFSMTPKKFRKALELVPYPPFSLTKPALALKLHHLLSYKESEEEISPNWRIAFEESGPNLPGVKNEQPTRQSTKRDAPTLSIKEGRATTRSKSGIVEQQKPGKLESLLESNWSTKSSRSDRGKSASLSVPPQHSVQTSRSKGKQVAAASSSSGEEWNESDD